MSMLRLLGADLRESLRGLLPVFALALVLFAGIDAVLWFKSVEFVRIGKEATSPSFGDCFAALFGGSLDMTVLGMDRVRLPMGWVAVMGLILYAPLSYPYSNLMGFGKQLLVQGRSRWSWWLGKCLWVLACVAAVLALAIVVSLAMGLAAGGGAALATQPNLPGLLSLSAREFFEVGEPIGPFIVQVAVCLSALCLVQLALSLVLRPLPSYVLLLGFVTLSSFYSGAPFMGELCMWTRTALAVPDGVSPLMGITVSAAVGAVAVVAGGVYFSKMDIMDKELNA